MQKFFNIAGPCHPDQHYMLPAQARCQGALLNLIEEAQYFVIHAARQTGKTTLLLDLAKQLNASGNYHALYCSLESVQQIDEVERGIPAIVGCLQAQIQFSPSLHRYPFAQKLTTLQSAVTINTLLRMSLSHFCQKLDKPLVILFDEVDCLSNGTLISFLRQLREGYINRGQIPFVQSLALVGMRNIRDYKAKVRDERDTLGSASPFNIVTESLTLRNFSQTEIAELYAQHSAQTGQVFAPDLLAELFAQTQGQPWLVNAIGREITRNILHRDTTKKGLPAHLQTAIQNLIQRRDTHIDSLMERLRENRVQRIIEPIILGKSTGYAWDDDDYQYVLDLGLLHEVEGQLMPANPIYAEVIVRALTSPSLMEMQRRAYPPEAPAYLRKGTLDMHHLLSDFQHFWRQHSESWIARYQYQEAAPHLILHAFLYRIINGGGRISREMAAGNGRLDLCLHYQGKDYPIELKIRYSEETYAEGKKQLLSYMDKLACTEGWLVVFDRRKQVSWEDKLFHREEHLKSHTIHLIGC